MLFEPPARTLQLGLEFLSFFVSLSLSLSFPISELIFVVLPGVFFSSVGCWLAAAFL